MKNQSVKGSLVFILFILFTFTSYAGEHDFIYKELHKYEIEKEKKGYSISGDIEIKNTYLSENSLNVNHFFIPERFYEKIKHVKASKNSVRLPDWHINLQEVNSEDVFISDDKIYTIDFVELNEKDSITYSYSDEISDIAFAPIFTIPNIDFVEQYKIIIEHPDDVTVDFEFFFPLGDLQYNIVKEEDETVLSFDSLKKKPDLYYYPYKTEQAYILLIIRKNGDVINASTPGSFMKWYSGLLQYNSSIPDSCRTLFDSLLIGKITDTDKLAALNSYIANKIRYIADEKGHNSIVPRSPSEVLKNMYGDCKDRAFLLSSLAHLYGIKVDPVLVSTGDEPLLKNVYVYLYDHVICSYASGANRIYFDPTSKYNNFGILNPGLLYKEAFILDTLNPHIETIMGDTVSTGIEIDIKAGIDTLNKSQAVITLKNEYSSMANYALKEFTGIKLQNYLSSILSSIFNYISFEDFVLQDSSKDGVITFRCNSDITKLIIPGAAHKYVNTTPFNLLDNSVLERDNDTLPVFLKKKDILKLSIELKADGYQLKGEPFTLNDSASSLLFDASCSVKNESLFTFNYYFHPSKPVINNNEKKQFLEFCKNYFSKKREVFLLQRKTL